MKQKGFNCFILSFGNNRIALIEHQRSWVLIVTDQVADLYINFPNFFVRQMAPDDTSDAWGFKT